MLQQLDYGGQLVAMAEPMYQYSYRGKREYVPPRCSDCIDKALAKMKEQEQ